MISMDEITHIVTAVVGLFMYLLLADMSHSRTPYYCSHLVLDLFISG